MLKTGFEIREGLLSARRVRRTCRKAATLSAFPPDDVELSPSSLDVRAFRSSTGHWQVFK